MQIVIELPEWKYKEIIESGLNKVDADLYWAIYNGTPIKYEHIDEAQTVLKGDKDECIQ